MKRYRHTFTGCELTGGSQKVVLGPLDFPETLSVDLRGQNHFCNSVDLWSFLEKAMAPHFSTLAWKIPWMEEPSRLQSMESLRVRHN